MRKSRIFDSKQAAKDWAARQEYLILNGDTGGSGMTFAECMDRYGRDVSVHKRSRKWEVRRLMWLAKLPIAEKRLRDLKASDFAAWRDARAREVSAGTVIRDMTLMSSVLNVARKEWGLIDANPLSDVRRPREPEGRDRLPTAKELEALAISAGGNLDEATARAFHAFLFAIETGMRAGEIMALTWEHVHLEERYAHLPITKNGTSRDVPLSSEAVRLLQALPVAEPVFGLSSSRLDALWRKLRDRAGVVGLTFHDSRAEAVTRLSKRLDVLDLARMIGHRDIRQLQRYYRASASELAKRLG